MSTKILNGPAKGATAMLRRAPVFLRVTIDARGKVDYLDQLTDLALPGERLHAYRCVAAPTEIHVLIRGKNRSAGGFYQAGEYELCPEQPDDATMRDNAKWREWCHGPVASAQMPDWARKAATTP